MADNNNTKLVRALAGQWQGLEDALQQLYTERGIDTAVGAQLDLVGAIVGQPRNGLDDDDYRRLVSARSVVNRSDGAIERIIKVTRLVIDDEDLDEEALTVRVENHGNATQVVAVDGVGITEGVANLLIAFLEEAQAGGVRTILESNIESEPTIVWFRWDTVNAGWDEGIMLTARDRVLDL